MSLRDSMRTHRKSMMKRLSFNPLQAFAGHTEGGSKAPTLVEGDSASSEDGQGADASSGDASSPVSPETTEAQHLADFKKEERPPIDDHYRPHLEELGQWPDDQLLKQLRAHGHLDAYSEATLLETRRNTLGALESTLKYHECYVKEQIRQADDPVTYPEVELPRMRAGEEGQLNAPRTYQPRHIRFPREISIGGTTAEFEDACKWLRGQGPHSTLDQPNIGKLTDGQLGKHGPLLKIYALTNFNDMRTRDKLWYKNNRDFQIGLLNALDAAQIPRTSLCAKSGHSIFTIGAGPQDSTVWHLGELIKVLLRLERRLTRVTPSAQTLSDAAVAVQKGPDSDLLQTPEALLAAKKPYQNVRSTQKKNTNWCAGTAQEQIAMFNDYFCWLLIAPWPHDAHDAHVDANDMREGDRSVWRFAARCLPRLNLIEDWLDLRRRKAREWLPHIRNTIEVLIRVYDGAKVEPGTITDSKELFYCLAWRGCLDSRSWAKDHEWGTILQDWILLATHDIIQILEGFRRPDVAAPEQVKMTKWRVVKGWVKTW